MDINHMTGNPSASQALFNCATECALRRKNRRCRCGFGDDVCMQCKYYINKYIDADPRQVELYMREVEFRAGAIKATSEGHRVVFTFLIAICLLFAWLSYKDEQRIDTAIFEYNARASVIQQQSPSAPVRDTSSDDIILSTLYKVSRDLDRKIDVNKDGKINCIDAAVLFYKHFPDKSKVCIEANRNTATGMNHLFNCVFANGVWRAVEPQAFHSNRKSYWMRDIWGSKYDSSKNKDVTADYIKYVK